MLYLDTETYQETPISFGTYRYAESVEIMVWAYAIDDGIAKVYDATTGKQMPDELAEYLTGTGPIMAHNAAFDRTMLTHTGWPTDISRWHCTMAQALAHGLPGSLEKLGEVMGIEEDHRKLTDGKKLVRLFCCPRPKKQKLRRATRETHPDEWVRFLEYARNDIEAMRAIYRKLPAWNYQDAELALWHLDQTINSRGITVDLALAQAAIISADRIKARLADRTSELTFGEVGAATQRDALLKHILEGYGVSLPDLRTSTLESLINGEGAWRDLDLPEVVRDLIEIRIGASRTSSTKYQALIKATSSDGRLRGTLQFCGASRTGRWAGRVFQPQNLSRVPKYLKKQYDAAVQVIKDNAVDLIYDNPMEVLGACVRGALVAAPGHKFCISDLSNIEGRGLAWAAGETWKLHAFAEFDRGHGADLYKLAYAKAFNIPVEDVDDGDQRQIGKVMELALGYAGGVGAFVTFAAAYGIDLEALADQARLPADIMQETGRAWDWATSQGRTYGLPEKVWRVCDGFKRLWRRAHPETVAWWGEMENAARFAIRTPGVTFECRRVRFLMVKNWLRMILPSGRSICYPAPRIGDTGQISYMGINQFSRKWSRIGTYSGKLVENCIQGIARDVLAGNMPLMEEREYQILLSIHDEVITEVPDTDAFSSEGLSAILATNPPWADGFPLAAAGFETRRYRKE